MEFLEASAKDNRNVKEAFYKLATEICQVKLQQSIKHGLATDLPSMSMSGSVRLQDSERNSCTC